VERGELGETKCDLIRLIHCVPEGDLDLHTAAVKNPLIAICQIPENTVMLRKVKK